MNRSLNERKGGCDRNLAYLVSEYFRSPVPTHTLNGTSQGSPYLITNFSILYFHTYIFYIDNLFAVKAV